MIATISKYKIERVIGEGGMGRVYLGIDSKTGAKAAIKELHAVYSQNAEIRMRFHREAMTMSSLNHPSIIKFYEFLERDGGLYLIMEYAEGRTLDQYISEVTGPIPETKAIDLFDKILDAFSYAHNRKVVHRDIKPSNIVITPELNIKILDFGVAKILDSTDVKSSIVKTVIGTVIGTSTYMSPEQAQGLTIDTRTDIYSLGILLFYIISGQAPFDAGTLSDFDLRSKVIREPLPKVRDLYKHTSDHIQEVIDKATHKNLTLRYQNCEEFRIGIRPKEKTGNKQYPRNKKEIKIGRSDDCDITINNSLVSRVHGIITPIDNENYLYKDVSVNGTIVNGTKILNGKIIVQKNDSILIAGDVAIPWDKIIDFSISSEEVHAEQPVQTINQYHKQVSSPIVNKNSTQAHTPYEHNNHSYLIEILAFLLPPVGWFFYFSNYKKAPKQAHLAGLLGVLGLVVYLILRSALTN